MLRCIAHCCALLHLTAISQVAAWCAAVLCCAAPGRAATQQAQLCQCDATACANPRCCRTADAHSPRPLPPPLAVRLPAAAAPRPGAGCGDAQPRRAVQRAHLLSPHERLHQGCGAAVHGVGQRVVCAAQVAVSRAGGQQPRSSLGCSTRRPSSCLAHCKSFLAPFGPVCPQATSWTWRWMCTARCWPRAAPPTWSPTTPSSTSTARQASGRKPSGERRAGPGWSSAGRGCCARRLPARKTVGCFACNSLLPSQPGCPPACVRAWRSPHHPVPPAPPCPIACSTPWSSRASTPKSAPTTPVRARADLQCLH